MAPASPNFAGSLFVLLRAASVCVAVVGSFTLCSVIGCTARPVPRLERGISALEAEHDRARGLDDHPVEQVRGYLELRIKAIAFRADLDGETELRPNAKVRASSSHAAGIGWVSVDRRDIASVRARADRLIRSLDRFITTAAPVRLKGTGFTVADGQLVEQALAP